MTSSVPKLDDAFTSPSQLVAWMAAGAVPDKADWRIGSEHERFLFNAQDNTPLCYEGEKGIVRLLEGFFESGFWNRIEEEGVLIGLEDGKGASITLEPGGQIELSGAPLLNLHQTCNEITTFDNYLNELMQQQGIGSLLTGFIPEASREAVPWMPKKRYAIMRPIMAKAGNWGLDMMLRTATVQVNLDYADEADMIRKMRVSTALQPAAIALFANSPLVEGKETGFLSWRSHVWTDTDPARCGMPFFVFEEGFGYARWVEYVMDIPVYSVYRGGEYLPVNGATLRDFLKAGTSLPDGSVFTVRDAIDHIGTVFPEVRLKTFIEMRGSDVVPRDLLCALPAFWVGLLYDEAALAQAESLCKGWSVEEIKALHHASAKEGLKAEIAGRTLQEVLRELLSIARKGLQNRAHKNANGDDESIFITPLMEIVETGMTLADHMLEDYRKYGSADFIYERALRARDGEDD